ncbi:hypothetical protein GCM10023264_11570 [Sphingomonas daechungensis]|uniref:Winged helix-turn-helix transcriptional regulator n=1 Tax=Sphingomonas daechungensis TaxID=1176646 RepID=A0ABX6SXT5_9SPHN|nr:MarR family winged helix-turn-helix transcriptional regulator [Sphingomonas daechungensis]QNP42407.1 winged helix-turn-helix transcriptional regulator [Sphingomonas daechungensis]
MTAVAARKEFNPATLFPTAAPDVLKEHYVSTPPGSRPTRASKVRQILQARLRRDQHFSSKLFSDPAWDMLLELYAADSGDRRLSISRLSERTQTALTTTLRWIQALESEGLVERARHPLDGRQVFIVLTHSGRQAIDGYFDDIDRLSVI